jgi:hypothetical protein
MNTYLKCAVKLFNYIFPKYICVALVSLGVQVNVYKGGMFDCDWRQPILFISKHITLLVLLFHKATIYTKYEFGVLTFQKAVLKTWRLY